MTRPVLGDGSFFAIRRATKQLSRTVSVGIQRLCYCVGVPYRRIQLIHGDHYHVFNRGVEKRLLFCNSANYRHFLLCLREHITPAAHIVAYCLMPNHFHLVLVPHSGNLSDAMKSLGCAYAAAFNKYVGRRGPLFESRFRSIHVSTDIYLHHLTRYIHLNPVTAGMVDHPNKWCFSSYCEYLHPSPNQLCKPDAVLQAFGGVERYREFVETARRDDELLIQRLKMDDTD